MGGHTRRAVLGGIAVGLTGCSGLLGDGDDEPTDGEPTDEVASPTEEQVSNNFYVENMDDVSYCTTVTVEATDGDEVPVDGNYVLQPGRGIRFDDVGVYEREYQVSFQTEDGADLDETWSVDLCGDETSSRPRDGRAAAVRVEGGGASLLVNQCDAISVGNHVEGYLDYRTVDDC